MSRYAKPWVPGWLYRRTTPYRSLARARKVMGKSKGYLRVGGYYGRFTRRSQYAQTRGELKFHDIDVNDTIVSAAGAIPNTGTLVIIPQGTSEKQRIGRKCTLKSIGCRYDVKLNATAAVTLTGSIDIVRIILYQDMQCNGVTAAVLDILESADYQSYYNLANKSRFRFLMDRSITLNIQAAAGDGTTNDTADFIKQGKFYKKCNIPIEYNATDGTIDEIRSNNIGLLLITRLGVAGFASKFRFRFSDN